MLIPTQSEIEQPTDEHTVAIGQDYMGDKKLTHASIKVVCISKNKVKYSTLKVKHM